MQRATATDGAATPRNEALAGFVLSLLGLLASLYPGDLLVALPLLFAGLYVSITAFRVASRVAASRRLAIAGAVIGVLGLITTVILFVVFIE